MPRWGATTPSTWLAHVAISARRDVDSANRYGIEPDGFYQRHYWLYRDNPSGTFADWNPRVSCGDEGDNGG